MPPDATTHTVPLPLTITRTLAAIASDLADMPRECVRDPQELCLWKGRLARRLRGVLTMRVPVERQVARHSGVVPGNDTLKLTRKPGRTSRVETRQLELVL